MGYTPERSKIEIILGLKARKDIILGLNSVRLMCLIYLLLYCTFWIYYSIYLIPSIAILSTVIIGLLLILYIIISISIKHLKDYKRFSGHYSIRPPIGYYDDFDFENNKMY